MFSALELTREVIDSPSLHLLRILLGPDYNKPIEVKDTAGTSDRGMIFFRFHFIDHFVRAGSWIVRNRKTNEVTSYEPDEYHRLFYEYTKNPEI